MDCVVLLSGGIDSTTAFYLTQKEHRVVLALSFDYGSKHNAQELKFARYHAEKCGICHEIIDLDFIRKSFKSDLLQSGGDIPQGSYDDDNMKSTVVPFRNGIMLAIAAGYTESIGAKRIVIAAHSGDHAIYPDCRPAFIRSMGEAIAVGTYEDIQILCPFLNQNKGDIVRIGAKLGVDYSQTWSCYCGGDLHCGKCGTCVERREAFAQAGIPDPTRYQN